MKAWLRHKQFDENWKKKNFRERYPDNITDINNIMEIFQNEDIVSKHIDDILNQKFWFLWKYLDKKTIENENIFLEVKWIYNNLTPSFYLNFFNKKYKIVLKINSDKNSEWTNSIIINWPVKRKLKDIIKNNR